MDESKLRGLYFLSVWSSHGGKRVDSPSMLLCVFDCNVDEGSIFGIFDSSKDQTRVSSRILRLIGTDRFILIEKVSVWGPGTIHTNLRAFHYASTHTGSHQSRWK